jgi:hypothetical protein
MLVDELTLNVPHGAFKCKKKIIQSSLVRPLLLNFVKYSTDVQRVVTGWDF